MKVKITVLRKEFFVELAEQFIVAGVSIGDCPELNVGDEFVYEGGAVKPEGFCPYAWIDLYPSICSLMGGRDQTNDWYKNPKTKILCCTDGVRPVVFKLEQIDS